MSGIETAMALEGVEKVAGKAWNIVNTQLSKPIIGGRRTTVKVSKKKTITTTTDFSINGWMVAGGVGVMIGGYAIGVWHWDPHKFTWKDKDGNTHEYVINLPSAGPGKGGGIGGIGGAAMLFPGFAIGKAITDLIGWHGP